MTVLAKRVPRDVSETKKAEFKASMGAVAYCKDPQYCLQQTDGSVELQKRGKGIGKKR